MQRFLAACDAGGTMTDVIIVDETGRSVVGKAPTTPRDESIGYMEALFEALDYIGVVKVEVISAAPLSQDRMDDLQRRLVRRSGKRVQITHRVDPSLIAGIRLIADGVVMDTSVKRQLADMREKLYKGGVFYPWMQ